MLKPIIFSTLLLFCSYSTVNAMQIYVQIFVNAQIENTLALDVEPGDNIEQVKAKIQEIDGYDPLVQVLYFGDILLEDGATLADYNIPRGGLLSDFISSQPLPVELNSFTSTVINNTVKLNWTTATEVNSSSFDVEKTTINKENWISLSSIKASGNSNSPKNYSFVDRNIISGKYNYRLKMVDNDGTFKYSTAIEANISEPYKFALEQNFPNPFNPSTTISFTLPLISRVVLSIYNELGQKVAELFNGEKAAGSHSIEWNAGNFNSGIYFYELKTEKYSLTKKLILMK